MAFVNGGSTGVSELCLQAGSLVADLPHADAELLLGPVRIADKVEKPVFLVAEGFELFGHLFGQSVIDLAVLSVGTGQLLGHHDSEAVVELDRGVVNLNELFDGGHPHERQVAGVVNAATAREVEVLHAGFAAPGHDDESFGTAAAP